MDVSALHAMVAEDRRRGFAPWLLVANAGSVNVGAIDDLDALADVAEAHGLWMHVDGAFGAAAVLSDEVRPRLRGMGRASSLAFDFHKWLHVNYDCGCVLVRDGDTHLRAFSDRASSPGGGGGRHSPDYLAGNARGLAANAPWPVDLGIELSRGFRALKVWSHLLEHGTRALGAAITANLRHAEHLAALVDKAPTLTRLAPLSLQIVVFRYEPAGLLGGGRGGGGGGVAGALRLVCERTGWLAFFLCGLLLCERVMHSFGTLLEREIELAFFVPLIIGHGGNSGGQAVSTVIRSIGRRSPSASEAISTVATEALAGALQSLLLGCLVGPALHFFLDTSRAVSTVMATTLPLLGLFSNCTGAMLPFLVTWAGLDPAVIVGPLMTTLVDTLGLMIYLSVATATLVHAASS
mmetsp:Transcript_4471/g.14511  ORF Transcript_4471/g.14511 Transcript_4471/m.14511 type:complete len:408 (-) Transcript_4471:375-1598(-)